MAAKSKGKSKITVMISRRYTDDFELDEEDKVIQSSTGGGSSKETLEDPLAKNVINFSAKGRASRFGGAGGQYALGARIFDPAAKQSVNGQDAAKRGYGSKGVGKKGSRASGGLGSSTLKANVPSMQRATVKISYIQNNPDTPTHWRQHGIYLTREGVANDSVVAGEDLTVDSVLGLDALDESKEQELSHEKVYGFSSNSSTIDVPKTLYSWQAAQDQQMFKVIISPEHGSKLNLQDYTKAVMAQVEKDFGTKIQWVGVAHYNTSNPHVHVCVRGVDERGDPLIIHPSYIKEGFRLRAQEEATKSLGYRTERDLLSSREKEVNAWRVTSLDRQIMFQASKNKGVFEWDRELSPIEALKADQIKRRLELLKESGLITKQENSVNKYDIPEDFLKMITKMGQSKDRQKALAKFQQFILDKDAPIKVNKPWNGFVCGRLMSIDLNEHNDKLQFIVEGHDGAIHFINANAIAEGSAKDYKPGTLISLEMLDIAGAGKGDKQALLKTYDKIDNELVDLAITKGVRAFPRKNKKLAESFASKFANAWYGRQLQMGNIDLKTGKQREVEKQPRAQ